MDSYKLIPPGLVMFIKEEIDQEYTTSTKQREEPGATCYNIEENQCTTTPTDTDVSDGDASSEKKKSEITVHIATEISNTPIKSEPKEAGMIINDTNKAFKRRIDEKCGSGQNTLRGHARSHLSESVLEMHSEKYACNSNDSPQVNRRKCAKKKFECENGDKRFTSEASLRVHRKSHCRAKRYECKMCDKYFWHLYELDEHIRTHFEEKPLECEICGKCCKTTQGLASHKRFHIKPFQCKICGKLFKTTQGLAGHKWLHSTPFECGICGKCENESVCLARHKKIHVQKPFKCEQCGKWFTHSGALTRHEKYHTGK